MKIGKAGKQKGFTIIELVVVILLLGILTATALPRFMDVTDQAHEAVVNGTLGGLSTGVAMFHAQWVAEGEPPGAIAKYGLLFGSTNGYPVGLSDDTLSTHQECEDIFTTVLQGGAPVVDAAGTTAAPGAIAQADINGVDDGTAFVAAHTAANVCTYAYIGQYNTVASDDIPAITYNVLTGAVTTTEL